MASHLLSSMAVLRVLSLLSTPVHLLATPLSRWAATLLRDLQATHRNHHKQVVTEEATAPLLQHQLRLLLTLKLRTTDQASPRSPAKVVPRHS